MNAKVIRLDNDTDNNFFRRSDGVLYKTSALQTAMVLTDGHHRTPKTVAVRQRWINAEDGSVSYEIQFTEADSKWGGKTKVSKRTLTLDHEAMQMLKSMVNEVADADITVIRTEEAAEELSYPVGAPITSVGTAVVKPVAVAA